jgi:hypothetical protein
LRTLPSGATGWSDWVERLGGATGRSGAGEGEGWSPLTRHGVGGWAWAGLGEVAG